MSVNEALAKLRTNAESGNPDAARELGRLLNLGPGDPTADDEWQAGTVWPGEPWLRSALAVRPDDTVAAVLLGGILLREIDEFETLGPADGTIANLETSHRAHEERMREAETLYTSVSRRDPGNEVALMALDVLASLRGEERCGRADEAASTHSFYLLVMECYSGSAGVVLRWALPELDELRWAFDVATPGLQDELFLDGGDQPAVELRIETIEAGQPTGIFDVGRYVVEDEGRGLTRLNWDGVAIPPLAGDPLPMGHIVSLERDEGLLHYGFSVYHDI